MDKVFIEGLECMAHVGVPEEERRRPQKVLIDINLFLSLAPAGSSDSVERTVDYAAAAQRVRDLFTKRSYKIVEAMAEDAAQLLLAEFQSRQVTIRIRKFSVPGAESVGVAITRGKLQRKTRSPRAAPR